jgi:myo-inositol-1(or 4)-monophosphatase
MASRARAKQMVRGAAEDDGEETGAVDGTLIAELRELASAQARGAGRLLLEKYRSGIEHGVRSKSTPTDLVSDADVEAERYIREGIARVRPDDGMLGEEGDDLVGESGLRWVVDPLDGTVNYLFGIPHWCVSVAVQDARGSGGEMPAVAEGAEAAAEMEAPARGTPSTGLDVPTLAGAVYDPLRDELFASGRDGEPTMNGEPIVASTCANLAQAMVATGFNYNAGVRASQGEVVARLLPRVRDIRRFGAAALDLVWTAMGRYDAFYERGPHTWDVAAGALICERAGLQVRELPERDGLPWGVLVAPDTLVDDLIDLVRR